MSETAPYTITLDDDPLIHKFISRAIGIQSLPYASSAALLARVTRYQPMALFLDIHLGPDDCGLDAIPAFRKAWPFTPILVTSADEDDAALGDALAAGANDFVRKPIRAEELAARLKARITEMSALERRETLAIGPVRYLKAYRSLSTGERSHQLAPGEALLFECLLQSRGMTVPRAELKRRVWGDLKVSENALDKKIHDLRGALRELTDAVKLVSVYGKGFSLNIAETDKSAA